MVANVEERAHVRLPHLDDLRTVLVAWVIGGHALLGCSAVGGWAYEEVREVTFSPVAELVLVAILGPFGLFVIGLFFFVAGLLTERAVARHGPRPYARDRVLLLGLPWLASALLVWPASVWLAYSAADRRVSFWWVFSTSTATRCWVPARCGSPWCCCCTGRDQGSPRGRGWGSRCASGSADTSRSLRTQAPSNASSRTGDSA